MSTNTWIGIGNLTRDPETSYKQSNNTAICKFSIAVNEGYGDKQSASYIPIVVFGKQAESCQQYLAKGSKVCVEGRIKTGSYTSQKTGQKVYTTDIIASHVDFLTPVNQPQNGFGQQQAYGQPQGYTQPPQGFQPQQGFGQHAPQQQSMFPQQQPAQQPQQAPPQDYSQQPPAVDPSSPPPGFQALQDDDCPF